MILKQAMVAAIPVLWAEPVTQSARKLVIWLPGFSGSKEGVQNNDHNNVFVICFTCAIDPVPSLLVNITTRFGCARTAGHKLK
jgi:hypothetical protein